MSGIRRRAIHKRLVEQRNTLARDLKAARIESAGRRALINELMYKYCREEMAPEQIAEVERDQVPATQTKLDLALAE